MFHNVKDQLPADMVVRHPTSFVALMALGLPVAVQSRPWIPFTFNSRRIRSFVGVEGIEPPTVQMGRHPKAH